MLLVCAAVTVAAIVLVASLSLWVWYEAAQVERFYREHRLLGEMHAGQRDSTNDSAPARQALLKLVPMRVDKEAAVAVLRSEGFGCQTIAEPITDTRLRQRFLEARGLTNIPINGRTRKDLVDCQTQSPSILGYVHWIIDLEFDADGRLSEAGVAKWNIFLASAPNSLEITYTGRLPCRRGGSSSPSAFSSARSLRSMRRFSGSLVSASCL